MAYIDYGPIWTIANRRPLYIERRPTCLHCVEDLKVATGRFIPKDPAIPSIAQSNMKKLATLCAPFPEFVIASVLDSWPPSSRIWGSGPGNRVNLTTFSSFAISREDSLANSKYLAGPKPIISSQDTVYHNTEDHDHSTAWKLMQSKIRFPSVQRYLDNSGNSLEPSQTATGNIQALGGPPEGLQGLKIEQAEPKGRIDMSEVSPSESPIVSEYLVKKRGRPKGSKNRPKLLLCAAVEPEKSVLLDVASEPPFKKMRA